MTAGTLEAMICPVSLPSLPEKLTVVNVLDGLGESADFENMAGDVSIVKTAYGQTGNREELILLENAPLAHPGELYGEWIE